MDRPEITNFASLIRHALAIEDESLAFYQTAAGLLVSGPEAELARELAEQHESRRRLVERTRQQKLNEMVLEPISGLDGSRYAFDGRIAGRHEIRARAVEVEGSGARFYRDSAVVAESVLTEAARTFRKLAEANEEAVARAREGFSA